METPSKDRIVPGSVNVPIVDKLNAALPQRDIPAITALFLEDGFWRDHLCLTWDLRTAKGRDRIASLLASGETVTKIEIDRSTPARAPQVGAIDAWGEIMGVLFYITVTTNVGSGRGVVRLAEKDGRWLIYTLYTALREIKGHEESIGPRRPFGARHGEVVDRRNWLDRRTAESNFDGGKEPAVVIVGAGQSGLSVAARLKMLGIEALVMDEEERIGDNWRRRYHQLVLHDPVWYDHMPYVPFPAHWPVFTPKDKLAEFFECYAKILELNVWTKTTLRKSAWSEAEKIWTLELVRRKDDGTTETRTLHPRHVIQATGHSGKKNLPEFTGVDRFQGSRICHSSEFHGAAPGGQGRKAVVVGSCNSAHDIAQDYYEKGYEATIVQRSSTCVVTSDSLLQIALKGLYDETSPPTDDADLLLWSIPTEQFKAQQIKVTAAQNEHDKALLDGLAKAGFQVDRGPDDAGLLMKYFQRGGGYTIEVGAGQLIAEGKIKVKQGQEIAEILPRGVRFADGSELEADEIVFATGYQNMRTATQQIFGDAVADRVGDVWGMDAEGEMRTIWRRSGHPGFWFMGGNLALGRYYSQMLALQIAAVEGGLSSW